MHLVTVLRALSPLERATGFLATRQGISTYEARTRLTGEFPRVVGVLADASLAEAQAQGLCADGFDAAVLDGSSIEHDDGRDLASTLTFGDAALRATLRDGRERAVTYDEITLLIHGVRTGVQTSTEESTVKSFSATRAVLTGGLSMRSSKTVVTTKTSEVRETFVYVRTRGGGASLAIYERGMNYAFLGAALAPSSMANFLTVLGALRARCEGADYDNRMMRPAGFGLVPLAPSNLDPAAWKSDVAAALIALGHRGPG